jgi:isoleucyl-tRNA synthetase
MEHTEEKRILDSWKKSQIYEKVKKKNAKGKKFYLMDGPPYATGHIHMGTALNKILKDIVMRAMRLQGYDVFDRAGYDTHGVPIEFQIEKEIGSKSKKDIEKFGVKKFIDKCKQFATQYIGVMNDEFENLGVWMDFKNPYLTLSDEYIESIWHTFKIADEKKLLYLGKYPVHICPRCETAVAYNEIEYSKQEDNSIYVKFPVKSEKNKFLIIWTTTPWTLPGNTGVMANPSFDYSEIEVGKEKWILAKDLIPKIMSELELGYTEKKTLKGKELEGIQYINPLAKNLKLKTKNAYKVILSSRYVNLEDGTGLVHCAPGHGKEDYEAGKEYNLDIVSPVDMSGSLTEEAGKYSGKKARIVDAEIIDDLKNEGFLVYKHAYSHDYPLCWRCKSPLLMIAVPQWFFKIDSIHKRLMELNEQTNWIPNWMQLRMKAWLEGVGDWPISRKRYWGTPLPIWMCEKCNQKIVIGSIDELKKLSGAKKISVHKPEIDDITIPCKCHGIMKRVPEVLDVWFDSGVSSWAALGYPKSDKLFKKFWPADINIEGKDQIRGWWNSQMILSAITFDKKPFENISVHGMVLDLGKRKMSKSFGNIISPHDIIEKYGRDYMRYYFAKISKGEDFAFDEKEFVEIKKAMTILQNIANYIKLAGNSSGGKLMYQKNQEVFRMLGNAEHFRHEDKWIMSRLNSTVKEVTEEYNKYHLTKVVELLEEFLVNDLSRNYIQLIRERVDSKDKAALATLNEVYSETLKLFAPIIPFTAEKIYQEMTGKESIFLDEWPKIKKDIDKSIEDEMTAVRKVIEKGMEQRNAAQLGLRWPLAKAIIKINRKLSKDSLEIVKKQLNVKDAQAKESKELGVELDTKLTPELEAEGFYREISRKIQDARKKSGLKKEQQIALNLEVDKDLAEKIYAFSDELKEKTGIKRLDINGKRFYKNEFSDKIKDKSIKISFDVI